MKQSNHADPARGGHSSPCIAPHDNDNAAAGARKVPAARQRVHDRVRHRAIRAAGLSTPAPMILRQTVIAPASDPARQARIDSMGELVVSIAHEVHQPLAAATLNARAALHSLASAQSQRDLAQVEQALRAALQACEHASGIVRGIRGMAQQQPVRTRPCRIDTAWQQLQPLLAGELQRHRIRLQLDLCPLAHSVLADPVQLQQVLFNLATNAITAMAATPRAASRERVLAISSRQSGGAVQISVADNGAGLARVDCERVFERLYTTRPGGMGMGLKLCRTLVEAHGGAIWAEPGEQHGCIFHFRLPVAASEEARHA